MSPLLSGFQIFEACGTISQHPGVVQYMLGTTTAQSPTAHHPRYVFRHGLATLGQGYALRLAGTRGGETCHHEQHCTACTCNLHNVILPGFVTLDNRGATEQWWDPV
jgi:hypothetical protein